MTKILCDKCNAEQAIPMLLHYNGQELIYDGRTMRFDLCEGCARALCQILRGTTPIPGSPHARKVER